MSQRLVCLLVCLYGQIGNAAECSSGCSTAFTTKCIRVQCGQTSVVGEAYTACRRQISSGQGPLIANDGCVKDCTDTADMAATKSSPCPTAEGDGDGDRNSSGSQSCAKVPSVKPKVPTLCTAENQGCVDCGSKNIKTYVFWPADGSDTQRAFHLWNFDPSAAPSKGPLPVLLHMDGYGGGKKGNDYTGGDMGIAANYYGFVTITVGNILKDGAGGFGLEFGNDGIANDQNLMPCKSSDSRDIVYLEAIFKFIEDNPLHFDKSKVYTEGFSQNSMFAIYTAVCFADKVAGTWQGGSGMAKTYHTPITPGVQAQCSLSSSLKHGTGCCETSFCTDCQYWPLYPRTCENKLIDCLHAYTDDGIACGSDWYMYEAMVAEGNDARLLSFSPITGGGGHKDPKNEWAWKVGCLGIVPSCSSTCTTSFGTCMDGASDATDVEKFATCEGKIKNGELSGCTVGCAPTLAMLQRSEKPVVTLSKGKFGTETGLAQATGSAPKPACGKSFGSFADVGIPPTCRAPSDFSLNEENPGPGCSAIADPSDVRSADGSNTSQGRSISTSTKAGTSVTSVTTKANVTSRLQANGNQREASLFVGIGAAVVSTIVLI
eukprot:TRINITY_DN24761_c0_g1_i2.p1 TRINITY_DN24761_c0_g1~~TRINITY_DN24761_c0_g1_i2.p1  ORF type:complete len:602 (-),score=77.01 TRINITY_DN24761_c0_g1_i2:34-1839(-)